MNYETVELKERIMAGISARTNNFSPDMGKTIGGLPKFILRSKRRTARRPAGSTPITLRTKRGTIPSP